MQRLTAPNCLRGSKEERLRVTNQQDLAFTFTCLINAPVDTVFTAITDQHAISTYFTDASSGPLTPGATVLWRFGDLQVDVKVEEVVQNQCIVCDWPASGGGRLPHHVHLHLPIARRQHRHPGQGNRLVPRHPRPRQRL